MFDTHCWSLLLKWLSFFMDVIFAFLMPLIRITLAALCKAVLPDIKAVMRDWTCFIIHSFWLGYIWICLLTIILPMQYFNKAELKYVSKSGSSKMFQLVFPKQFYHTEASLATLLIFLIVGWLFLLRRYILMSVIWIT